MQLAPLAPIRPSVPMAPLAAPSWMPAVPTSTLESRVAAPPIVDFPGIEAGQSFDVVKGSKVGWMGVTGKAKIERFDADGATFRVTGGRFGLNVDVLVSVERIDDQHVRISSRGSGIPDMNAVGRIITSRTNFTEFERVDAPDEHTVISHDGNGGIVIDTVVPTFGAAHLVLERI